MRSGQQTEGVCEPRSRSVPVRVHAAAADPVDRAQPTPIGQRKLAELTSDDAGLKQELVEPIARHMQPGERGR